MANRWRWISQRRRPAAAFMARMGGCWLWLSSEPGCGIRSRCWWKMGELESHPAGMALQKKIMRILRDLNDLQPDQPTILTIGNFDGVHRGHADVMRAVVARAQACNAQSA